MPETKIPTKNKVTLLHQQILSELSRTVPMSLGLLCEQLGVKPSSRMNSSDTKFYCRVSTVLQELKERGDVRFRGGRGAGWTLR